MQEIDDLSIHVTHFVNPHHFYFKYEDEFINPELDDLEQKIAEYASEFKKNQRNPEKINAKKGDVLAVFNTTWSKWIRAEVDDVAEFSIKETKFVMWAIDHGKSFVSTRSKMLPLPAKLADCKISSVYRGGIIDCVPAELRLDYTDMKVKISATSEWSENVIKTIDNRIYDAAKITFDAKKEIEDSNHLFGRLEITVHSGSVVNVGDMLIGIKQAKTTENFFEDLAKLNTHNYPRWKNSQGSATVLNSDTPNPSYVEPVNPALQNGAQPNINEDIAQKIHDWNLRNDSTSSVISNKNIVRQEPKRISMPVPSEINSMCPQSVRLGGHNSRKLVMPRKPGSSSGSIKSRSIYDDFEEKGTSFYGSEDEDRQRNHLDERRAETLASKAMKKTNQYIPSGYECDINRFQMDNSERNDRSTSNRRNPMSRGRSQMNATAKFQGSPALNERQELPKKSKNVGRGRIFFND